MSPHARPQSSVLLQRCASTSSVPSRRRSASESTSTMYSISRRRRVDAQDATGSDFVPTESIPVLLARSKPPLQEFAPNTKRNIILDHHDDETENKSLDLELSAESTSSGEVHEDRRLLESTKDSHRKYHALMELLCTEVSYLEDLRILVSIYLRNIPTLTRIPNTGTFGRNSSFASVSRNSSYTQLTGGSMTIAAAGMNIPTTLPMTSIHPEKTVLKHLFTDMEVELLTRNAEDVLRFHERFVEELKISMNSLGIPMESVDDLGTIEDRPGLDNVDAGIAVVSTKFATESSRFNLYQTFCAGHPEALDILRREQQLHPTEWDLFEQRCGASALERRPSRPQSVSNEIPDVDSASTITPKRKRRTSISAVDQTVRTIKGTLGGQMPKEAPPTEPTNRSRLFFMDYMIKPVQRICKYPLLLDQLKTGKSPVAVSTSPISSVTNVNVVVESAALAMRHVAGEVDEARRRHDVAARSLLIVSRISVAPISTSMSSRPIQVLTSSFLSSLGTCLFAGTLDVIHNRSTKHSANMSSINVKYLGAFLYAGGYLILVKVHKGKVYDPRHWFRLSEFQITDPDEMEAWLPCSFRLACNGYEFELAAACHAEKETWLAKIRESLDCPVPAWINEPASSLQLNAKHESATPADGPCEVISTLPTIQSISEDLINDNSNSQGAPLIDRGTEESPVKRKTASRSSTGTEFSHPSRQSSSASVRSILSPMVVDSETIVIRRCLPSARAHVNQGLHDVISDQCLTARSYAALHEGGLFQAPHISRSGTSRSNSSALSMKKLKKHESVRVARKSLYDDGKDGKSYASRTKSLSRVGKRPKALSIASNSSDGMDSPSSHHHYHSSSPPSSSHYSFTMATSSPVSYDTSPIRDGPFQPSSLPNAHPEKYTRKARHSLVGSVRNLFFTRVSGASSPEESSDYPSKNSSGILKRWVKAPHRRANSAPDNPNNPTLESLPTLHSRDSPVLPELDRRSPLHWTVAEVKPSSDSH
ncbi:hypothetical protein V5O48_007986 [Marasmius crinis-equi]|uniref:DH domain-containing protein n=1 Tax=Marasmius crinis-equi TaxID=585013 RepID=A0ABR3FFL0_9AGAR